MFYRGSKMYLRICKRSCTIKGWTNNIKTDNYLNLVSVVGDRKQVQKSQSGIGNLYWIDWISGNLENPVQILAVLDPDCKRVLKRDGLLTHNKELKTVIAIFYYKDYQIGMKNIVNNYPKNSGIGAWGSFSTCAVGNVRGNYQTGRAWNVTLLFDWKFILISKNTPNGHKCNQGDDDHTYSAQIWKKSI